jgi:hypothetical protein
VPIHGEFAQECVGKCRGANRLFTELELGPHWIKASCLVVSRSSNFPPNVRRLCTTRPAMLGFGNDPF